jgi:hypothetical protein
MSEFKPGRYESVYAGKTKDGYRLNLHGEGYIPTNDGRKVIVIEGAVVTKSRVLTPKNTFASSAEAAFRFSPKNLTMGHAGVEIDEEIVSVDEGTWVASLSRF